MIMLQTRTNKKFMFVVTAIFSMMLLMVATINASAAPAAPKNVKQTSAFGSYAKITWDAVSGAGVKYQLEVSQDNAKWATLATVGKTYYTAGKMEAGKVYYIRVKAIVGKTESPYSATLQVIPQPGYVSEIKQTAAKDKSVTISWTGAAGATAYDVYIGTTEENMKYNQTIKGKTSATINKLKKNKTYIVKVIPFNISASGFRANGFERGNTAIRTIPGKISGLTFAGWNYGSKDITVTWKAKDNVDGYQVKFYNAQDKCVKTINTTKTTATFKKAANNTYYKVKIRPYLTMNGKKKYGAYNKYPVYPISQPQLVTFTQDIGKLSIGWNAVEGATSYSVYVTTTNPNKPSSYVKVADVEPKVLKYEMSKFGKDGITLTGNYYAYVVANKKVGQKTYSSKITQAWYCCNN